MYNRARAACVSVQQLASRPATQKGRLQSLFKARPNAARTWHTQLLSTTGNKPRRCSFSEKAAREETGREMKCGPQ